jgi:hypothetical protein
MPQIFEMMDAKARQDCIKEIDLLRVGECNAARQLRFITERPWPLRLSNVRPCSVLTKCYL